MKKEYKDFYRFLWEYLEGGNSALVIKPRICGMTSFMARYAAWCIDYKDMSVEWKSINHTMNKHIFDDIQKYRSLNWDSADSVCRIGHIMPHVWSGNTLTLFDEIDFLKKDLCGFQGMISNQVIAGTSINDFKGITEFYNSVVPSIRCDRKFKVFNISDYMESKIKFGKL